MFETGCCGTNLRRDNIHFLGVFVIAYPLFCVMLLCSVLIYPTTFLGSAFLRSFNFVSRLRTISLNTIDKAVIFPRLKCGLSASFYGVSPILSGKIFQLFNFLVLTLSWVTLFALTLPFNYVF